MPPMTRTQESAVLTLLQAGHTNLGIAEELGMAPRDVGRVRRRHSLPSAQAMAAATAPTLEKKWRALVVEVPGGHLNWTGRRRPDGTPVISHEGSEVSAARVAFGLRTDRTPTGRVTADCDYPRCVAPAHNLDREERQTNRVQMAALMGKRRYHDHCRRSGHDLAVHGWVDSAGRRTCLQCRKERRAAAGGDT